MKTRNARRPKVVTTDFRTTARPASDPPGVNRGFPLEREFTRPGAAASPDRFDLYASRDAKDAREHDKGIEGLGVETLRAIAADLGARTAYDRRDHEHRWIMGRRAAVLRKLLLLSGR